MSEELRVLFAKAPVPSADIITPNQFEPESLVRRKPATIQGMVTAARGLAVSTISVTRVRVEETPPEVIHTLLIDSEVTWMTATPKFSPQGPAIFLPRFF